MDIKVERGRYGETKITFRYRGKNHLIFVPAREPIVEYLQDKYNYIGSELWILIKRHIIPYFVGKKARQLYVL